MLGYLCDGLPRTTTLIVTTHDHVSTLPIPTLTGRLSLLDQSDLALLPDEATQVIVETCPDLAADVVEELVVTCAGWTAACWEVALNSHHHPAEPPIEWLREHGCERITSAALACTTPDAASLLVETSFLEELSASLCDSVLGRTDSAQVLAEAHSFGSLIALRVDRARSLGAGRALLDPTSAGDGRTPTPHVRQGHRCPASRGRDVVPGCRRGRQDDAPSGRRGRLRGGGRVLQPP